MNYNAYLLVFKGLLFARNRLKLKSINTSAQAFSCEFCEIFKKSFLTEHPRRVLLKKIIVGDTGKN